MAGVARRRPNQNSRQDCVRYSLIQPGQALLRSARRGLASYVPSYAMILGPTYVCDPNLSDAVSNAIDLNRVPLSERNAPEQHHR